ESSMSDATPSASLITSFLLLICLSSSVRVNRFEFRRLQCPACLLARLAPLACTSRSGFDYRVRTAIGLEFGGGQGGSVAICAQTGRQRCNRRTTTSQTSRRSGVGSCPVLKSACRRARERQQERSARGR